MTSGIYCFQHKTKPFIYIGSSIHIEERYKQHLDDFKRNTHHNPSLQKDFSRELLDFEILAKNVSEDNLIKMEQLYCEDFLDKGYFLYNSKLPRPQGYDKNMIVSTAYFEKVQKLTDEIKRLRGYLQPPSEDNIFVELMM